jgi:hypothetical protein
VKVWTSQIGALAAFFCVLVSGCGGASRAAQLRQSPSPSRAASPCPADPQAVSPQMKDRAFAAVRAYAEATSRFPAKDLRLDKVTVAASDTERGGEVRQMCSSDVAARTLIVYTTRSDLLPSASLSEGVYFTSRLGGHFETWYQAH